MTFSDAKDQVAKALARLLLTDLVQARFHVLPSAQVYAVELIAWDRFTEVDPSELLPIMNTATSAAHLWELLEIRGLVRRTP